MNKKNPDRIKKDCIIRVRVTEEERERFIKRARESGYPTVSAYIRSLIAEDFMEPGYDKTARKRTMHGL